MSDTPQQYVLDPVQRIQTMYDERVASVISDRGTSLECI